MRHAFSQCVFLAVQHQQAWFQLPRRPAAALLLQFLDVGSGCGVLTAAGAYLVGRGGMAGEAGTAGADSMCVSIFLWLAK